MDSTLTVRVSSALFMLTEALSTINNKSLLPEGYVSSLLAFIGDLVRDRNLASHHGSSAASKPVQ